MAVDAGVATVAEIGSRAMTDTDADRIFIKVAFGLLVGSIGVLLAGAIRRLSPWKMSKKTAGAVAGFLTAIGILIVFRSGLPDMTAQKRWAVTAVLIAGPASWVALAVIAWFSIQTKFDTLYGDLIKYGERIEKDIAARLDRPAVALLAIEMIKIMAPSKEDLSEMRAEIMSKIEALQSEVPAEDIQKDQKELADMQRELFGRVAKLETAVGLQQAGDVEWLKSAVDLIHVELGKIPVRSKADLDRIRGPEHVVIRNGVSSIRHPQFANISELNEAIEKLDAKIKQTWEFATSVSGIATDAAGPPPFTKENGKITLRKLKYPNVVALSEGLSELRDELRQEGIKLDEDDAADET